MIKTLLTFIKPIPVLKWLAGPTLMVCSIIYERIMNPASFTEPLLDCAFWICLFVWAWISITVTRFAICLNLDFVEAIGLGSKHPRWSAGCAIMLTGLAGNLLLGWLISTLAYDAPLLWILIVGPAVFPLPTAIVVAWQHVRGMGRLNLNTTTT